jgi:hypothetical protein
MKDDLSNFGLICQQCHLVFISEFNVQMLYLPGLKNFDANFLSRPSPPPPRFAETVAASAPADAVNFKTIATKENSCAEMHRLLDRSSLQLVFRPAGAQRLAGNVSRGGFCPIVPQKFRKDIFFHFHNISHPGRLATRHMVSSTFVWGRLASDITAWSRACLHC